MDIKTKSNDRWNGGEKNESKRRRHDNEHKWDFDGN